jgi:hypothetical protein
MMLLAHRAHGIRLLRRRSQTKNASAPSSSARRARDLPTLAACTAAITDRRIIVGTGLAARRPVPTAPLPEPWKETTP